MANTGQSAEMNSISCFGAIVVLTLIAAILAALAVWTYPGIWNEIWQWGCTEWPKFTFHQPDIPG